jgi:hypothetical protein
MFQWVAGGANRMRPCAIGGAGASRVDYSNISGLPTWAPAYNCHSCQKCHALLKSPRRSRGTCWRNGEYSFSHNCQLYYSIIKYRIQGWFVMTYQSLKVIKSSGKGKKLNICQIRIQTMVVIIWKFSARKEQCALCVQMFGCCISRFSISVIYVVEHFWIPTFITRCICRFFLRFYFHFCL